MLWLEPQKTKMAMTLLQINILPPNLDIFMYSRISANQEKNQSDITNREAIQ